MPGPLLGGQVSEKQVRRNQTRRNFRLEPGAYRYEVQTDQISFRDFEGTFTVPYEGTIRADLREVPSSTASATFTSEEDPEVEQTQETTEDVRDQLEDTQLQRSVYETCKEQGVDSLARPDTARWPRLEGGFFSGMRRNVDAEEGILTLRAVVNSEDEFDGIVTTTFECIYDLTEDNTTARVVETEEPSKYTVTVAVEPDSDEAELTIIQTADASGTISERRIARDTRRRNFNLRPGTYGYEVTQFGFEDSEGTFTVPTNQMPIAERQALPTANVTFTSIPDGIEVNLPDGSKETTPFTAALPVNTDIRYIAFPTGEQNYQIGEGTLDVSEDLTYEIELTPSSTRTETANTSRSSSTGDIRAAVESKEEQVSPDDLAAGVTPSDPTPSVEPQDTNSDNAFVTRYELGEPAANTEQEPETNTALLETVEFTSSPTALTINYEYGATSEQKNTPFTVDVPKGTTIRYEVVNHPPDYLPKRGRFEVNVSFTQRIVLQAKSNENANRNSATPASRSDGNAFEKIAPSQLADGLYPPQPGSEQERVLNFLANELELTLSRCLAYNFDYAELICGVLPVDFDVFSLTVDTVIGMYIPELSVYSNWENEGSAMYKGWQSAEGTYSINYYNNYVSLIFLPH